MQQQQKKRADQEAKQRDQDLRRLEAFSKARNKKDQPAARKGRAAPVKDFTKDPCSRPKINREEGSALVKSKLQSTQSELKSTEMLQKTAQQQSRPDKQTPEQSVRKSVEPQAVGTTQHVDSKGQEESKQLCDAAPLDGKVSNIVEDSDDDSTAASGVGEDAPDSEEQKAEIVTKLQSLLEVRKGMLQNNLKVHEVDQTIKALEVEFMALLGSR